MFDPVSGTRTTNCENIPRRDAPVQRVALPVRLQDDVPREPQGPVD